LLNACNTSRNIENDERSGVELYFLAQDGSAFKTTLIQAPYFYVAAPPKRLQEALAYVDLSRSSLFAPVFRALFYLPSFRFCQKTLEGTLLSSSVVSKEDLDLPNHLSGLQASYIQLVFRTVRLRRGFLLFHGEHPGVGVRLGRRQANRVPHDCKEQARSISHERLVAHLPCLLCSEYDVPYLMRVAIDKEIRIGAWYSVHVDAAEGVKVDRITDMVDKAEPVVLAFDIECTKAPLKFPDATSDQIYMISYMVDRQGFLICNREFVSQDVDDFEYTPKSDYPGRVHTATARKRLARFDEMAFCVGPFECVNVTNEFELIRYFFNHVKELNPHIFVTYNGDFFDWPFLETRAQHHGYRSFVVPGGIHGNYEAWI
ncbi:hypothetical protein DYB32_002798, partial [Aphanomyces invadans]